MLIGSGQALHQASCFVWFPDGKLSNTLDSTVVSPVGYGEFSTQNLEIRKIATIQYETQICHLKDK